MIDLKAEDSTAYPNAEKKKVANVISHMATLCTAVPIKNILRDRNIQARLEDRAANAERNFAVDKCIYLTTFYGDDGVLDLPKAESPISIWEK